jgi:hypothetical protein
MPSPTSLGGDVRFVAAGARGNRATGSAQAQDVVASPACHRNAGGFHHVRCAAVNNRPRNNDSACFSPRTHHPSGQERRPAAAACSSSRRSHGPDAIPDDPKSADAAELPTLSRPCPCCGHPPQNPAQRAELPCAIAKAECHAGHSREASTAFSEACAAFLRIMSRIVAAFEAFPPRCLALGSQFIAMPARSAHIDFRSPHAQVPPQWP